MGIVAVGDSLVAVDQSWGYWLSRAMGLPLRMLAVGGSRSKDVLRQVASLGDERYDLVCLSVGTNDVLFDWDVDRFADNVAAIVTAARQSADRVVTPTISLGLVAFPGSASEFRRRVRQANSVLSESGALVFSGSDLRGPRLLGADRIHPTAAGQLLLADRAAQLLDVHPAPSSLTDRTRVRGRWTYYRVTAWQVPRRILKRALGRPMYRAP